MDFDSQLKTYIENAKPYVCILTPCYGGMCHVEYTTSLINTMNLFRSLNINLKIEFCRNDSLVPRARNNLIAKAMNDANITHIFFIDSDIIWEPVSVLKLLIADKELIGGVYPLKNYSFGKLAVDGQIKTWLDSKNNSQLANIMTDEQCVQYKLLNYNLNLLPGGLSVKNNIGKVKHIATGFMMIQRKVIEQMFQAFPSTKYTDDISYLKGSENDHAYALFDCGVEDDHYYSEDWMFCSRWSKMGGDIWVDVSINLTHIGVERYSGSYLSELV